MRSIASWLVLVLFVTGCSDPNEGLGSVATDIYEARIVHLEPGDDVDSAPGIALGEPIALTDHEGFDNQPNFLFDGSGIYYSSGDGFDINVNLYSFEDRSTRQLTHSFEREYSAAPIPGMDAFSAVRVEEWGEQRLWSFDAQGNMPELLCEWEDQVGYYAWVDRKLVALVVLHEDGPSELRLADPSVGWVELEATAVNVGRSIHFVPARNSVSFLQHNPAGDSIYELDLLTRGARRIVANPAGSLDHAWGPSGTLFATAGSKILGIRPGIDSDWVEVANFAGKAFQRLSRLAISPRGDRLVFVAEPFGAPSASEP